MNILPFWTLVESNVISGNHLASLTAYNQNVPEDSVLLNWLGLGIMYINGQDDIHSLLSEETPQTEQAPVDNQQAEPNNGDGEEQDDDGEKTDQLDLNEEEEEEQRRRNEMDLDDDFTPSLVYKPQQQTTDDTMSQAGQDVDDGQGLWQTVQRRPDVLRRLVAYIIEHPTTLTEDVVDNIQEDLWNLSLNQRFDLYRYWLLRYRMHCHEAARDARQEYNRAIAALAEYYQEEDYHLLKDSVIVAMTTTGAARYHTVLEKLREYRSFVEKNVTLTFSSILESKIVIVEEAAAIFEAHIITALSTGCEHLILIGDHVQLRPNPSVYTLATKYQLEVSLFERLVKNDFPNVRLNIQVRHSSVTLLSFTSYFRSIECDQK